MNFITRLFHSAANRQAMLEFGMFVDRMVADLPGSDDGVDAQVTFSEMSNWRIVCEEMVDTDYARTYHERAFAELRRRGISDAEILEMRRFAWLTAGWLNVEKMLWDWACLDEDDIVLAINWQYSDGWISWSEKRRKFEYFRRYTK